MANNKCDKCGREVKLVLEEKGEYITTEIYRCLNLRCGYMFRVLRGRK
ncbi:hypothetical protein [Clostridium sp. UBA4395]